jgi:hypothetical protein
MGSTVFENPLFKKYTAGCIIYSVYSIILLYCDHNNMYNAVYKTCIRRYENTDNTRAINTIITSMEVAFIAVRIASLVR